MPSVSLDAPGGRIGPGKLPDTCVPLFSQGPLPETARESGDVAGADLENAGGASLGFPVRFH